MAVTFTAQIKSQAEMFYKTRAKMLISFYLNSISFYLYSAKSHGQFKSHQQLPQGAL